MEETQLTSASSKYSLNSHGPTNAANDGPYSSTTPRGATHPLLPECCPSSVLHCHPSPHHCHPSAHHCHQQQPQHVRQPTTDACGTASLEQVSLLNEIKSALRNIHEGIVSIAGNAVVQNIPKDNDKAREAPSTKSVSEREPNQVSEKVDSNSNDDEENPEHIDVVSVEILNVTDSDDSVASADDFVPEIPSIGQASLN